tara:strand:- start:2441 stop:2737 length:297 start_codon:yes stop_codon:yes gene_type:complete
MVSGRHRRKSIKKAFEKDDERRRLSKIKPVLKENDLDNIDSIENNLNRTDLDELNSKRDMLLEQSDINLKESSIYINNKSTLLYIRRQYDKYVQSLDI